ncbi:beta-L-arabinofuranosidase domain-containing protein [Terriglobus sp. RCC_193]|uniref:beta-L-arabinofuranosidase domain-containing protein n=1 Tax=Terriglobus sp. RCC_193 TaxID=3239218 RepID=UPI00352455CB
MLRLGAMAVAAHALPDLRAQRRPVETTRSGHLSAFPLSAVRLLDGPFKQSADVNEKYLDSLQTDRLLHSFRLTSGITSTATPYGGWEIPTGELRGHFSGGHFLSAVAFASSGSGNTDLRRKGEAMVAGLVACQKANGNGYLSAYSTDLFERLAIGKPVWAPFYTYHKIMAGLVDMYVQTGNEDALKAAEGMSDWVVTYFADMGDEQRQRILRTEYGGMNEVLVNLYSLTGKERHLRFACKFEQPTFLDPLAARRDELQGLHANTSIPKIIGAARMYEVTGDRRYRDIAEYFLDDVLTARTYVIGNTSDDEHWKTPAGSLKGSLSLKNAECCVAYNLMKLERHLYQWTGEARWMDAYERTLFNARLGTQNAQGLKQYFFPLAAGYWRSYGSAEDSFWCCTGTGAEDFAKFGDSIYFHSADTVYVNQFIASELTWQEKGLSLRQDTRFPESPEVRLTVGVKVPQEHSIAIRIPSWAGADGSVAVNGKRLEAFAEPGSYLVLRRTWHPDDTITLQLPMTLREETLPGTTDTVAALYGPLVLAATMGDGPVAGPTKIITGRATAPEGLAAPAALPAVKGGPPGDWLRPVQGSAAHFQSAADGAAVMPLYQIRDQKYSVYWQHT